MRQITPLPSKTDLCYESLHTAILRGELSPGSRLVIQELANQLGVSQIPIREALQRLQADGFVEVVPYLGTRVTEISADSIHETFEIKETLELVSAHGACQRMTDEEFAQLEEILRKMDTLVGGDIDGWSQQNVRFHEFICDRAGTPLAAHLMTKVLDHWERLRRCHLSEVLAQRIDVAHKEHWDMFHALQSRDPERVDKVIRDHNRIACAAYAARLSQDREKSASQSVSTDQ